MEVSLLQEQSEGDVERERRAWSKARAAKAEASRAKHVSLVSHFVHDLVEFVLRIAHFREQTGGLVPKKEYNDWLSLLLSGDPKMCSSTSTVGSSEDVMNQAELSNFLESSGEWTAPHGEPIAFNKPLGEAAHLVKLAAHEPQALPKIQLTVPVRIAIIGAPFTGKSTLAKELAKAYSATVLDPEKLVSQSVAAAEAYTAPAPQVCNQHLSCVDTAPAPQVSEQRTELMFLYCCSCTLGMQAMTLL
jgi:ABC-type transport system involved in cytochrome bd biosynthesis fused ATPase/permease subunit